MQHQKFVATSVGINYSEFVSADEISDRVKQGEIIVVSKGMQSINCFDQLRKASLEGIHQVVGKKRALQVEAEGFEYIHNIIDLNEITSVVDCTYEVFRELAPTLAKKLVKEIFQTKSPFYFEEYPNVRFHIPYDVSVEKKELSRFCWNGKITAHGPHHDSWYYCPTNCFNVWIAISPVKTGNGLTIYPQAYGRHLPCDKEGKILRNQYFGRAISFDLEPGDIVIFHGEHLHGSEINSTNLTRHVLSLRITLEKPRFLGSSPYKYDYLYCRSNTKLVSRLNQLLINTLRRLLKYIHSLFNNAEAQSYVISPSELQTIDHTSAEFSKSFPTQLEIESQNNTELVFNSSELKIGAIKPISQNHCIARLTDQRAVVFSRHCPHEGADLAAGHLQNNSVVCPWHNLSFSLENGTSPCKALSQLAVFDYVQSGDSNKWQTASFCNHKE